MHGGIRILCLLLFSTLLSVKGEDSLLMAALLFVLATLVTGIHHIAAAWPLLSRLRYFYLSLLVLYLWFTPGQALFPGPGAWVPTMEGLHQAAVRIGILVLIVLAVNLLLRTSRQEDLLVGLLWLLRPLSLLGVATRKLALRLVLVLRLLEQRPEVSSLPAPEAGGEGILNHAGRRLAQHYQQALAQADREPLQKLELPAMRAPGLAEWLAPILLAALMQIRLGQVY